MEIDTQLLPGLEMKAGDGSGLEALPFAINCVFPDLDQREDVLAGAIGDSAPALSGRDASDPDLGAGNRGAGGVSYQTRDFGGPRLRQRKRNWQEQNCNASKDTL